MLTEEQYLAVVRYSEGAELHFLWLNIEEIYPDFDQRKEAFFWVLKRLLEEGRARLASGGDYMKGTADEQIEVLRRAFPDSRFEMAKVMEKPSDPVDVDLDYLWFISDD